MMFCSKGWRIISAMTFRCFWMTFDVWTIVQLPDNCSGDRTFTLVYHSQVKMLPMNYVTYRTTQRFHCPNSFQDFNYICVLKHRMEISMAFDNDVPSTHWKFKSFIYTFIDTAFKLPYSKLECQSFTVTGIFKIV